MATITHQKVDNITSWTQTDLDNAIAGNPPAIPPGTLTSDIVLSEDWNADHTFVLGADENFVTDAQVTIINNTSGTNTGDVTVTDSAEIDFTLAGQNITASLKNGSIDEARLDASVNASLDLADSSAQQTFKTISVAGQSDVVADTATDTLTLVAGSNVTITTNATTDTITIAAAGGGGGTVDSVVAGTGIDVDATDPANPIVAVDDSVMIWDELTINGNGYISNTIDGPIDTIYLDIIADSIDDTRLHPDVRASLALADTALQDISTVIQAGTNITLDGAGTEADPYVVNTTITQYTDELAQDAVGAMVDSTLVYVDATPLLTRGAITGDIAIPQASNTSTLATVNSNVGSFTNASVTVNAKGLVTAASSGAAPATEAFKTFSVSGQSDVVADSATDTMTFVAGTGMTITTNAGTDTITFAASGGTANPRTLVSSTTQASHTGDTSETILATYSMPGGTMPSTGQLRITSFWSRAGTAANNTVRVRFGGIGGTAYVSTAMGTNANQNIQGLAIIYANNATNAQKGTGGGTWLSPFNTSSNAIVTSSVDTTASVDIVLTGQCANSGDTVRLEAYSIELIS